MAGKAEILYKSILNEPLLATEDAVYEALDFLDNRYNLAPALMNFAGPTKQPSRDVSEGRIAQIDMIGPMMKRAMGLEALCGAMGYDDYRAQFDAAFDNPNVDVVVLNIESGGGSAAGLFDLAQHVYDKKVESGKKMIAYVDSLAASAAYSMAVTADEIIVERTASVGSIGVITTHADLSKKLEKDGIVVTPIYAGKFKAAGNPYESLSEETKAMIQERVDSLYTVFVEFVARMRGMDEEAVRATEAKMFLAPEAVELGLADKIMSADEFMAYLEEDGDSMNFLPKTKTQENAVSNETVDMAEFEALKAKMAEYEGLQEKLSTYEATQAEMASQLEASKALIEQKEQAEYAAKLESFKEKAAAYSSFGLDAEAFAGKAMEADSEFVAMAFDALDAAQTKLEETADFEEKAVDAEGEGVQHPEAKSGVSTYLEQKYSKESK